MYRKQNISLFKVNLQKHKYEHIVVRTSVNIINLKTLPSTI